MQVIPRYITPRNREWKAGDKVTLVTDNGNWPLGIVMSHGRARFSAGWNKFVRDNRLRNSQVLVFTLVESDDGPILNVQL